VVSICFRVLPPQPEASEADTVSTDEVVVEEYGYSAEEESQWVDVAE
jgi:hypothetical protein